MKPVILDIKQRTEHESRRGVLYFFLTTYIIVSRISEVTRKFCKLVFKDLPEIKSAIFV